MFVSSVHSYLDPLLALPAEEIPGIDQVSVFLHQLEWSDHRGEHEAVLDAGHLGVDGMHGCHGRRGGDDVLTLLVVGGPPRRCRSILTPATGTG